MIDYIWVVNEQGMEGWNCPTYGQMSRQLKISFFFFFNLSKIERLKGYRLMSAI